MRTILSASKAISDDTIHVIEELEIEQLKRNLIFQYREKSNNDCWLVGKITDTIRDRITSLNSPHLVKFGSSSVNLYAKPAKILMSYDIVR